MHSSTAVHTVLTPAGFKGITDFCDIFISSVALEQKTQHINTPSGGWLVFNDRYKLEALPPFCLLHISIFVEPEL